MADALQHAGAHVDAVTSPRAALDAFQAGHYDVVVCDLAMPEMSGTELLRRLQGMAGPARAPLPAIAVSAYVTDADRAASASAGFQQHVGKPYTVPDLIGAVAAVTSGARSPQ